MSSTFLSFLFGVLGAAAVELLSLYRKISLGDKSAQFLKTWSYWAILISVVVITGFIVVSLDIERPVIALFVGASFPLSIRSLVTMGLQSAREIELKEDLQLAERAAKEDPGKTRPLWEASRIQLELYISRNLSQIRSIYWITLLIMVAGFSLVAYGVFRAVNGATIDTAIMTTSAGVLTEFIGATFLFIYRSTMNQAVSYVQTLERINAVGMSLQILDAIEEASDELRNKAKVDLAGKILALFSSKDKKTK